MPAYDLPRAELESYRTSSVAPDDLSSFWTASLEQARACGWETKVEPAASGLSLVDTYDVTFPGFDGDPVRAWCHRPHGVETDLPLVVQFQGYGGGRGLPHSVPPWVLAGYACLAVDTRGQGGQSVSGDTPDASPGVGAAGSGLLTRGLLDPADFYYRRVFVDAVRAVEAARALPGVDPDRVVASGVSQGGGLAVAVAALGAPVVGVMADVPFLCDFPRAISLATEGPYADVAHYLAARPDHVERALATLAYVDVAVLAGLDTVTGVPALFSVALMDPLCPPSTVFAAYHAYAGPKQLAVYPYNGHEGGHVFQEARQLAWLADRLAPGTPTAPDERITP